MLGPSKRTISAQHIQFSPAGLVGIMMAVLATVEYSMMWLYPSISTELLFSGLANASSALVRAGGSQFRLIVWATFISGYAIFFTTNSAWTVARVIGPFGLFIVFAIFSATTGQVPGTSLWFVAQWLVMITAATVAAQLCVDHTISKAIGLVICACAFASLFLAVVAPSLALSAQGGQLLLRGVFPGKNTAGWFACIGFIWILTFRRGHLTKPTCVALAALLAMLLWSGAKSSLAVLISVSAFLLVASVVKRLNTHWIIKSALTFGILGASALFIAIALPILIEALGKDPTLTGRTEIWGEYLPFMESNWWFGKGPGFFAFASEITQRIAETMKEGQRVYGVHSMYLALFGDTGLVGVSLYASGLLYVVLVPIYSRPSAGNTTAAALALAILIIGLSEAVEHIVPGVGTFMLIAARSDAMKNGFVRASRPVRLQTVKNRFFRTNRPYVNDGIVRPG